LGGVVVVVVVVASDGFGGLGVSAIPVALVGSTSIGVGSSDDTPSVVVDFEGVCCGRCCASSFLVTFEVGIV
jgi:hypothetical protein